MRKKRVLKGRSDSQPVANKVSICLRFKTKNSTDWNVEDDAVGDVTLYLVTNIYVTHYSYCVWFWALCKMMCSDERKDRISVNIRPVFPTARVTSLIDEHIIVIPFLIFKNI